MTEHDNNDIGEVDAKGGRRVKGMTSVLVISTIAAAVILLGIFAIFGA